MVDNVKKNIIVEPTSVAPQSSPAQRTEEYQPMFQSSSDHSPSTSPAEPTEAQVQASADSQEARAKHQQELVAQNKLEAEINKQLQEQGLEPTYENILKIADLIRNELMAKQLQDNLSEDEQLQLSFLEKMLSSDDKDETPQKTEQVKAPAVTVSKKNVVQKEDNIEVGIEKFLSGNVSKDDLINFTLNYIKKTNKDFDNLSEEEQQKVLQNFQRQILNIATEGKKNNYNKMTNEELAKASKIILLCDSKNVSLDEFSKLKPEVINDQIDNFEVNMLKTVITKFTPKDISQEEFNKLQPEQKLYSYIDELLTSQNIEYPNLTKEQKAEQRKNFIETLLSKNMGISEWNKLDEKQKILSVKEFSKDLEVALYNDIPLSKVMNSSIDDKSRLRKACADKNGYQIDKIDEKISYVISKLQESGKPVNYENVSAELKKAADNGDADAKNALKAVETSMEWGNFSKKSKFDTSVKDFQDEVVKRGCKTPEELVQIAIDKVKSNAEDRDEYFQILKNAAAWSQKSPRDWKNFQKLIEAANFTETEKKQIYSVSGQVAAFRHAKAAHGQDVEAYKHSEKMLKVSGHFNIAEKSAKELGKFFKGDKFDDVSTNSMKVWGEAITPALTDGMNNRSIMSFEESQRHAMSLMSSSDISGECKSAFTSNIVKSANNKQEVLGYSSKLSEIPDSAVTDGLAAAESFVKENYGSDVSKQYSSYVDNAIKNNGYSSEEVKNINTARETGQTSYERNAVSSDSNNTSNTNSTKANSTSNKAANNTTSAQTSNATANTVSTTSSTPAKVKVSSANSNAVAEMKAQIAQVNYEHSIALRDKALADLERVIDKIQNDQQVRAEKQAELAKKEAKTDEEIAQAIKEAEAKSVEEQKAAQEQITKETIAEIEQQEKLEKKYHISAETIEVLRNAQKQGDLSTIYTKLGEISSDAQKHFVQYLSRKDTATVIGFIRNQSSNKALIKELCRLNPGLIKSLDAQMLLDCGIEKTDIIKYSDSHQLSILMYDLAKTGNTRVLNQFYDVLGSDAQHVASMPSKPVPGDDRYFAMLNKNMSTASNKVAMRYDIDKKVPRELWG